ncbi:MAG: hypothetical protein LBQ75_01005 [Zoogloeaceae bacterium]|jgi:uncharacterized protein YjbI with pentapeptide repeats|nr:hypothetical protein [Zoogloeaceae bacterium]
MPSNPIPTTRRRFLASFLSLAAAPAEGFSLFGKKRARDLGKVYEYLKDADLRLMEAGRQRITIKNAYFSDEKFSDQWWYFDFVDCEFTGQYIISLGWLGNCTFTNCNFNGIFGFGSGVDTKFLRCSVKGESILSFGKATLDSTVFEQCSFVNTLRDHNHVGAIMCHGEILFIDCKAEGFALKGSKKLTLHHCTTISAELNSATPGIFSDVSQMPYSDFLLENCDFTRGVDATDLELNNFTMRNCKVGVFETVGSTSLGDVLIENIKVGHVKISASDFQGKLTVKNCSFFTPYKGHSFRCGGCVPTHTLLENLTCSTNPVDVVSTYGPRTEWKDPPPNKSFIIRNCDIPHLHVDWAQTEHLRIENCTFDTLLIRNGRIGKLEIIDCSLKKLDVSNTQVKEQNIRIPKGCDTLATGSNLKWLPAE